VYFITALPRREQMPIRRRLVAIHTNAPVALPEARWDAKE